MVEIMQDKDCHISVERYIVKNHSIKRIIISRYGIRFQVIVELKSGDYQVQIFYTKLSPGEVVENFDSLNDWWDYLKY